MQKESILSKEVFASGFFSLERRIFEVSVFLVFVLGLFSNAVFAQQGLPLEQFSSGIPASWAVKSNVAVANNWLSDPAGGYQGGGVSVDPSANDTSGKTAQYYLITPQFTVPGTSGANPPDISEIRFLIKQASSLSLGTTFQIRLSTANQPDLSGFTTVLKEWSESELNSPQDVYQEKIVTLPSSIAGLPVYLAFVAITNQDPNDFYTIGDKLFLDNVRVIKSCSQVDGITSTMTAKDGVINWTHPFATDFEVQVVPKGGGISAAGVSVNGYVYNITQTTDTNTPLKDGTNYDVYIKTVCDATTGSLWAGPFAVKTSILGLTCASPVVVPANLPTNPYVLDTNLSAFYDNKTYTPLDSRTGVSCQPAGSTQNWLSGDHAFISYTPTVSGLVNVSLATSAVSGGGSNNCFNNLCSVFIFDDCNGIGTTANCLGAITVGDPSSVTSRQLQNVYLEGNKTYYFVISSPFQHNASPATTPTGICFTFKLSSPTCPIPSGITYDNLTQTGATFSWTNPNNIMTNWQYIAKLSTAGAPVPSDIITTATGITNQPVTSLVSGSNYNFYVRAVCGGTQGEWSSPFSFTTQCDVKSVPYSTNFGTPPSSGNPVPDPCWSSLDLNKDGRTFVYSADASTEAAQGVYVRLPTMSTGVNTNDMFISPQIHFDGVKDKRLRFKFKGYGGYTNNTGFVLGESSFSIKVSTTGVGPNSFTSEILPVKTYQTGKSFVEKIVVIPANLVGNADVNIAWYLPPGYVNTASNFLIDDVIVDDMPDCPEPQYPVVTASTITTTSAQFSWTNAYNNISKWQVVAQPLGLGEPANDNNAVLVDNTNSTTDSNGNVFFTMTGLTPSIKYEYYVRSYCDATHQSQWIKSTAFNTLCDAQPTPYYESFDDTDSASKKFCWSVINKANDVAQWRFSATQASIQPQGTFSTAFTSYDDYLVSVPVNAVGNKILKLKSMVASNLFYPDQRANYEVLMSSTPDFASSTVLIPSHEITNNTLLEEFVLFTGTGTTYFAIHVPSTVNDPLHTGPLVIDDFSIEEAPKCPNPSALTVSTLTTKTAILSWTKGYAETEWQVAVQAPNSGVPTGSGDTVKDNPTYIAGGLTPDTHYEYYVRAVCGSDFSDWIGPVAFKTICNVLPTPFIETFEPDSSSESCWITVNSNNDLNEWFLSATSKPIFGQEMAALNCYKNGNSNDWMISPTLAVKPNQRLRFYYKSQGAAIGEDLKVQVSTEGTDISKFTTTIFDTATSGLITNTEVKEMVINLTGITAPTDINVAFHVPPGTPGPSGLRGSLLYIDNVIVEDIPACPSVSNVVISSISDKTTVIDWQKNGTEISWEISVQPWGTPAPMGNTQSEYLQTTDTHPYTITGLIPSTKYQVYVRPICNGATENQWVGPIELLTKCDLSNSCQYTVSLTNGNTGHVSQGFYVIQNGVVQQALTFPVDAPNQPTVLDYQLYLCSGIEWSLYWVGGGTGTQYSDAQFTVKDYTGTVIYTSPKGLGTINSTVYKGYSSCKTVTCAQPTNLAVNNLGELSWTPGASETKWEVFVQPIGFGSIPQSGVIVEGTPKYTPVASDFSLDPTAGTNEFFVRAICNDTDKSYWTGPKVFIRNDEAATAISLQVNTDGACTSPGTKASFIGATSSADLTTCGGTNNGDIWYEFVAASKVHTVELSNFPPGSSDGTAFGVPSNVPIMILSLYEVQSDGSLIEKACSENNSLVTTYSSELTVGKTYKIRIRQINTGTYDTKFNVCVSTPADICDMDAFNYSFEKLPLENYAFKSVYSVLVPGWRTNTNAGTIFFMAGSGSEGLFPYEGGQCVQLTSDSTASWDPNDPNIKGLYKDFETSSGIQKVNYSFASSRRAPTGAGTPTTIELWAGAPSGPFTMIAEHTATEKGVWGLINGTYNVPVGQNTTRFIFRVRGNLGGHLLDAANFKVPTNNVLTEDTTINCPQSSVTASAEEGEAGVGEWFADPNNPSATVIETPQNTTTVISGLTNGGKYIYYWRTRYCEKPFVVNYAKGFPEFTVTGNKAVCPTEPTTVTMEPVNSSFDPTNVVYSWAFNNAPIDQATNGSLTVIGASAIGAYTATVDNGGCISSQNFDITAANKQWDFNFIDEPYAICPGQSVLLSFNPVNFDIDTPGSIYTWTQPAGSQVVGKTLNANTVGAYNLEVDIYGCKTSKGTQVSVNNTILDISFTQGCSGNNYQVTALPVNDSFDPNTSTYVWTSIDGDFVNTDDANVIILKKPGTYTVKVTNVEGCFSEKSVTVSEIGCAIPKGISPDGDGKNDNLDLSTLEVKRLEIFNRYGTEVYSQDNYTNQWHGQTTDGAELPDGTYFYLIHYTDNKTNKGWIYINRKH